MWIWGGYLEEAIANKWFSTHQTLENVNRYAAKYLYFQEWRAEAGGSKLRGLPGKHSKTLTQKSIEHLER